MKGKLLILILAILSVSVVYGANNAKKDARRYTRQGWVVKPGALPLEKQLDDSYSMQAERDNNGYKVYITADASSVGTNYDGAKRAALQIARENLAALIQSEITTIADGTYANNKVPKEDVETITNTVESSKNYISQTLGQLIIITECYKKVPEGNEVLVRVAYNRHEALNSAKEVIRQQLQQNGIELKGDLDTALNIK